MAEFLYKLDGAVEIVDSVPTISDISKLNASRKASIKWLASEGITIPSASKFNPSSAVNRGAMAEFMYKLAGHPGTTTAGSAQNDHVSPSSVAAQDRALKNDNALQALKKSNPNRYYDVLWLYKMNITVPTDGKYNPANAVNRGSMAQFMHKLYYLIMTGNPVPANGEVPNI
jgi:hypothetical protein